MEPIFIRLRLLDELATVVELLPRESTVRSIIARQLGSGCGRVVAIIDGRHVSDDNSSLRSLGLDPSVGHDMHVCRLY